MERNGALANRREKKIRVLKKSFSSMSLDHIHFCLSLGLCASTE